MYVVFLGFGVWLYTNGRVGLKGAGRVFSGVGRMVLNFSVSLFMESLEWFSSLFSDELHRMKNSLFRKGISALFL